MREGSFTDLGVCAQYNAEAAEIKRETYYTLNSWSPEDGLSGKKQGRETSQEAIEIGKEG